ncbi:CbtB domain-containing protein [Paracoccus simplex]|uniref:CbtB domain-containing protein n=1 Tax=Paracoccus simplex TaxID=2086346 RepID=A0ABV7S198_9RHOB
MTARSATAAGASRASVLFPAIATFAIGFGLIFMAGLVQAETLHDAAHDVRHATGFPCH